MSQVILMSSMAWIQISCWPFMSAYRSLVDPSCLREDLDVHNFKLGQMNDPSEVLTAIYECLNKSKQLRTHRWVCDTWFHITKWLASFEKEWNQKMRHVPWLVLESAPLLPHSFTSASSLFLALSTRNTSQVDEVFGLLLSEQLKCQHCHVVRLRVFSIPLLLTSHSTSHSTSHWQFLLRGSELVVLEIFVGTLVPCSYHICVTCSFSFHSFRWVIRSSRTLSISTLYRQPHSETWL